MVKNITMTTYRNKLFFLNQKEISFNFFVLKLLAIKKGLTDLKQMFTQLEFYCIICYSIAFLGQAMIKPNYATKYKTKSFNFMKIIDK